MIGGENVWMEKYQFCNNTAKETSVKIVAMAFKDIYSERG